MPENAVTARFSECEPSKDSLVASEAVEEDKETPYFYSADGNLIAFVRIGSDSMPASVSCGRKTTRELKVTNQYFSRLTNCIRFELFHPF